MLAVENGEIKGAKERNAKAQKKDPAPKNQKKSKQPMKKESLRKKSFTALQSCNGDEVKGT